MMKLGVHADLSDFRWMTEYLENHPTRIYKLVPLPPTMDVYHDASRIMCAGVLLPRSTTGTREI